MLSFDIGAVFWGKTLQVVKQKRYIEAMKCTFIDYLPPGALAGDYNLHHVFASMCECVTRFSLKLLPLHIFGKLLVLMNFYTLQYFLGLVNFGLLLSE